MVVADANMDSVTLENFMKIHRIWKLCTTFVGIFGFYSVNICVASNLPFSKELPEQTPVDSNPPYWRTDVFKSNCHRIFNTFSSLKDFCEIVGKRMENAELCWAYMFVLAYREQKDTDSQIELFYFNPRTDFETCFTAYLLRQEERKSPDFNGAPSKDENTNIVESRINWVNGWLKFIKSPKNTLKKKIKSSVTFSDPQ